MSSSFNSDLDGSLKVMIDCTENNEWESIEIGERRADDLKG